MVAVAIAGSELGTWSAGYGLEIEREIVGGGEGYGTCPVEVC